MAAHEQPRRPVFPPPQAAAVDGRVVQLVLRHVRAVPYSRAHAERQVRALRTTLHSIKQGLPTPLDECSRMNTELSRPRLGKFYYRITLFDTKHMIPSLRAHL